MIVKAIKDCYINGRFFRGGEKYLLPSVPKVKEKGNGKTKMVDCDKFEIIDKDDNRMTEAQQKLAEMRKSIREEVLAEIEAEKKKKRTPEPKSFKQVTEETSKPEAKGAGAKK